MLVKCERIRCFQTTQNLELSDKKDKKKKPGFKKISDEALAPF